jgi:hypothetical protein
MLEGAKQSLSGTVVDADKEMDLIKGLWRETR